MKNFQEVISYIFHPLFTPIIGTLSYFLLTPKYSPIQLQSSSILPIFILTIVIPIISYFILKNIGIVNTIFMPSLQERKYPLYINITLLFIIVYKVIPYNYTSELYYFFLGLIGAYFSSLLLLFFNFKSSMHLISMGSLLMYLISLSVHFEINIILGLCFFTIATGLVASSRLYLKAHSKAEILIGFFVGVFSQLLTIKFWL
ncbi:hypothetical protein CLV91_0233 [Maribacter vaceletii]|uniref:PAP2 superfamily protein n=1 Tax=Maribacter vaceletii TaxID=1206816 RepID=A0A495EBT2_9FLAO|nr:hypothetical protein CLV91_0233 [Maribacter vaceletii]